MRAQVRELTETLDAICSGEVDAIIIGKDDTRKVYTLEGADHAYQVLVENISEGALIITPEGIVLYGNMAVADMVRLPLEKLLGTSIFDHIVCGDRPVFEAMLRGTSTTPRRGPIRLRRGSRSVPVLISMNALDSGGTRTISVMVTDRKQDVKVLQESEAKFRNLFETMGEGFALHEVVCDTKDNVIDYRFLEANPAFERLTGLKRRRILGRLMTKVLPGEDSIWTERFGKVAMTGKPDHFDHFSPVLNRHYDVFAFSPKKRQFAVLFNDITERKRSEDMLRRSEEKIRLAQEAYGAGIWDWNLKNNTIEWDSQLYALYGLDPEQDSASFDTWDRLLHHEDIEIAHFMIDLALHGKKTLDSEYRIVRPDGRIRWINAIGHGFYDEDGHPVRMTGICTDITERKQTEQALKGSEERFRTLIENSRDGFNLLDLATGRYTVMSPSQVEMTGFSAEEINGISAEEAYNRVHPDDREISVQQQKRIAAGLEKSVTVEYRWKVKSGEYRWFSDSRQLVSDAQGHPVALVGITRDITERKLAEEALQRSRERLIEALDLLEAATKVTDVIIAAQDRDFRYTYFNKAYAEVVKRITGKDLSIGMSMFDLFAQMPEELENNIKEWSRVMSGESINTRAIFGKPGQEVRTYHVLHAPIRSNEGMVIGAGEVSFDITEQANIERELVETKEYLENLIGYANAPIIVWDPGFRITQFNRAFERLTGRSADEVIGQHLMMLLPPDSLDEALDLIRMAMKGQHWESVEIPILHKDGGIRTVLWNSASIYGSDETSLVSVIAQGQDITERKKIEHELLQRAAELETINTLLNAEVTHRKATDTALKSTLSLLNAALESTADGIIVVNTEGVITSYNRKFTKMWNINAELMETKDYTRVYNMMLEQVKNNRNLMMNLQDLHPQPKEESYDMIELQDGRIFELYTKPQNIGDMVVGRLWSYRDITDRRMAEERLVGSLHEKEVLLREIHHRVKNNLQLVSGLLDMTRMRTADQSTYNILTDVMLKIQSMAQIHTRLYESRQFGRIRLEDQIRDQIEGIRAIYSLVGSSIEIEIHAPGIFLPVDQAIPCGLIVNELLSNAFKHAFKGKEEGTVNVTALLNDGKLSLTVKDDGIGLINNFDVYKTNSLGIKLVRTLTEHQLKGILKFYSDKNGTAAIVEFPVATGGN